MKKLTSGQKLNASLLFFVITLPLFLGGCLGAGTSTSTVDISGTWTLSTQTGNFTFTQIDNTLTGFTPTNQTISGTISGVNVNFSFTDSSNQLEHYTGTVTVSSNGTSMSGTFTIGSGAPEQWTGTLTSSTVTIAQGTWVVSDITNTGTIEPPFTVQLTQSNNTVSGTFISTSPAPAGTKITGTVSGNTISFSFTDSNNFTDIYTGTISPSGIQITNGTYSINGVATGTWSAAHTSSS